MEDYIIPAIISLMVGLLFGFFYGRNSYVEGKKAEEVTKELEQAREELAQYQEKVSAHFSQTAELVNSMTSSYRRVHEHLASGAQSLCSGDVTDLQLVAFEQPGAVIDAAPEEPATEQRGQKPAELKTETGDESSPAAAENAHQDEAVVAASAVSDSERLQEAPAAEKEGEPGSEGKAAASTEKITEQPTIH